MISIKKKFFLGLIFILISGNCISQNISTNENADILIENFFNTYKINTLLAFKNLISTNEYLSEDDAENLNSRIIQYSELLGEYHGYEIVLNKNIGEHVRTFVCLLRYDRQPVRFIITLYYPLNKWKVLSFKINDSLTDEIENAILELSYKSKL